MLCERQAGDWQITGQALCLSAVEAGWMVTATGEAGSVVTETDTHGAFRLLRLAPGVYHHMLWGDNRRISLPGVRLEEAVS